MSITTNLLAFGVRYLFNESTETALHAIGQKLGEHGRELPEAVGKALGPVGEHLFKFIEKRLTDHGEALPKALRKANDRAWQAVGLALAGESLFGWVKDVFYDADMKGVRDQIKSFLDTTPTGLENAPAGFRAKAAEEWNRLRKAKRFSPSSVTAGEVARRAASMERYSDPARMTAAAHQAVKQTAEALQADAPHLAQLLTAAPNGGNPLLVAAFAFFFRRELETNTELFHGLSFEFLKLISERQDRGLELLDARTAGILDQIDVLFDALEKWFAANHAKLDEINGKLDELIRKRDVVTRTTDPLKVSVTDPKEEALLRKWLAELRALPPELLDAAVWTKLGDALAAAHILAEARVAQEAAATAAKEQANRTAEAEAAYKMYRVACEQEEWADALTGLVRAATLDPARFAPFPLNRYEPVRVLGAGGFGTVVLCRERLKKSREVAVKTLHTSDLGRDLDELFGEAHTVSELDDPAIIKVIHWDFADAAESRPFLVMEYFPGISLAAHLKQCGRLSVMDFIRVARNVADAMATAHGAGVIHRDLKPGNILVVNKEGRWEVRVIDFGLAVRFAAIQASVSTSLPQRTRRDQSFAGTLEYASPEQKGLIAAPVGPRSDIYGFGKTMIEALLGTTDPVSDDWEVVPEDFRTDVKRLLERCVIRDPARRHPGFEAVTTALAGLDPAGREAREQQEREATERRRQEEEAEQARNEAVRTAERERLRKEAVEAERKKQEIEEAERKRRTAEAEEAERKKREIEEAERRRRETEAEENRRQEQARRKANEEAKKKDPFHPGRVRTAGETLSLKLPGEIKMTFAWCPPGTFRMGSDHKEGFKDEKPVHGVTLTKGFFMGIHPVTQAQWKAVMGTDPSHFKGPTRPVEQVSWDDCQEFCQKLTSLLKGRVTVRLPTEAEWEYACRAGTTSEFWFGDKIDVNKANYDGNYSWNGSPQGTYREQTTDVGTVGTKNPWGLYDVHGNIWEWCEDAWDEAFYAKSPHQDPLCTNDQTSARVLRGGSWCSGPTYCRAASRIRFGRGCRNLSFGCRVCFRLDG